MTGKSTPKRVAFMPWVCVETRSTLLGCRCVPYDRSDSRIPGEIHEVLACYLDGGGQPIQKATLIEADGELTGEHGEGARARIFHVGSFVAFSALLRRMHFSSNGYVNGDSFRVVIEPCDSLVAVTSTRRSGRMTTAMPRDLYRVRCPDHVDSGVKVAPDEDVLHAIAQAMNQESRSEVISDVLLQLLIADSDDPRVTEAMQLLLFSGSIQRLLALEGKGKEDDLASAFERWLSDVRTWAPLQARECSRAVVANDHRGRTLREAWYRDFYRTRGDHAHGRVKQGRTPCWSVREHLLMTSFVVPRLLLLRLQEWTGYTLTEGDRRELRAIDRLLRLEDLFGKTGRVGAEAWHWLDALRVLTTEVGEDGTEEDIMWPPRGTGSINGEFAIGTEEVR